MVDTVDGVNYSSENDGPSLDDCFEADGIARVEYKMNMQMVGRWTTTRNLVHSRETEEMVSIAVRRACTEIRLIRTRIYQWGRKEGTVLRT